MSKEELYRLLTKKGYKVAIKVSGLQVEAQKRVPMFELDYGEFINDTLEGKIDKTKVHMLDPWTFTIECE